MNTKARNFLFNVAARHQGDDCLLWPHTKSRAGYGLLRKPGSRTERQSAHRVLCEFVHGPPPTETHLAAHSCGKGHLGCVNPHHLSWKTPVGNAADRVIHGTDNGGERNGRAKLSSEDADKIRQLKGVMLQREIARHFRVSEQLISAIHTGRRWSGRQACDE